MSCSVLGIAAVRSCAGVRPQLASRPCSRLFSAPSSARGFSICLLATQPKHHRPPRKQQPALIHHVLPPLVLRRAGGVRTFFGGQFVPRHYTEIPPGYTDEEGLPFRNHDLSADEVVALFGPVMSTLEANKLLRILHGRRVAGTLHDPELRITLLSYSRRQQNTALEYLRKHVPVDEIANEGLRAEDELAAIEAAERGETIPQGKEGEGNAEQEEKPKPLFKLHKEIDPQANQSLYTTGVFDEMRARNKKKWEARQKQLEEEKRRREEEEAKARPGGLQVIDPTKPSPAMQKYLEEGMVSKEPAPEMKAWERILPSAVFVLLVTGALVAYAEYYTPPRRADRLFPDIPPAAATVLTIVAANTAVYALWKVPRLWRFLNTWFYMVPGMSRPLSFVGAMFSHQSFPHLAINMGLLWPVAVRLHDDIGRAKFVATYAASGMVGFLASLTWYVLRGNLMTATLGASGAVYGVLGAYFWGHRLDKIKFFDLPPGPEGGVPGVWFLALVVGSNISLMFGSKHTVDVASHLAGLLVGVLASHWLEMRKGVKKRGDAAVAVGGPVEAGQR